MKYLVKFFVVTFLLLIYTHASAEQKIAYLDMKFVLNNSKAGKGAQDFLQKSFKENQKKFLDEENVLKKEERDLLEQKATLSKNEYQKKTDALRKRVIDYQSQRRESLDKITNQRATAKQNLLKKLDPILKSYIKENGISLIIDKKNIIQGNEELDKVLQGTPPEVPGRPSLAQDVMKGRKTEIDYLNGLVSDKGREIGVETPYSDAVTQVLKGVESGEFGVGMDNIKRVSDIVRSYHGR